MRDAPRHEDQDAGVQRLLILAFAHRPFAGNNVEELVSRGVRVFGERLVQLDERGGAGRGACERPTFSPPIVRCSSSR